MDSVSSGRFQSWPLIPMDGSGLLLRDGAVYLRGWLRIRRQVQDRAGPHAARGFPGGLSVVWLAHDSPLDAFDKLFLSAHMTQHLLLMLVAPPLLLLGRPMLPLLRGLPRAS